jgi:hypothetical protein
VDVRGGGPLGENFGIAAEAVDDGGVEGFDEGAGFDDEGTNAGGVANGVDLVLFLLAALVVDESEVCDEVIDETRVHRIGDESGDVGGIFEFLENAFGIGEDLGVGVVR